MAEAPKFNLRNPAVKRIMQEIKEMKQDTSGEFLAEALETDIFEWHFVIRGPQDTEFDGGIYHGRILLPAEYPFKPPSFMMLSPNGRFETNVKICLSISSHHPEHWQPSWSVRTALTALIAFMPSPGAGALGALDFTKDERRVLAARSRQEAPRFGSSERQRVIDEMHSRMLAISVAKEAERQAARLAKAPGDAALQQSDRPATLDSQQSLELQATTPEQPQPTAEAVAVQDASTHGGSSEAAEQGPASAPVSSEHADGGSNSANMASPVELAPAAAAAEPGPLTAGAASALAAHALLPPTTSQQPIAEAPSSAAPASTAATPAPPPAANQHAVPAAPASTRVRGPNAARAARWDAAGAQRGTATGNAGMVTSTDHMLTALMWALYVGIGAILVRKVMVVIGMDVTELLQ